MAARATRKRARRPSRKRRAAARDGETEQRILDAAHAVFLRRGTAGARMQDIAARSRRQPGAAALLLPQQGAALRSGLPARRAAALPAGHRGDGVATRSSKTRSGASSSSSSISCRATPYLPGYILSELPHHAERAPPAHLDAHRHAARGVGPTVLAALRRQIDARSRAGTHAADRRRAVHGQPPLAVHLPVRGAADARGPARDGSTRLRAVHRQRRRELADFFLRALRP